MRLPNALQDLEHQKFGLGDDSLVYVRTVSRTSGLGVAGRVTEVVLNDSNWVALPATALTGRNALAIQNQASVDIKINYDNLEAGYVGIVIPPDGQRFYDITGDIVIYGKSSSGNATIVVEELS